ncbi:MAG: carbohydrate kinase [Balneolaceae bacterium]|nr:MAG: carbohydrate kinase [Balneolaceae bacterium]
MAKIIIGIGELLWDVFPDERRPGGAPANVVYHTGAMGNDARLLSRVGNDEAGKEITAFLRKRGINTSWLQKDPRNDTGTVNVKFTNREPSYTITENVAWDAMELTSPWKKACADADAFCFGTLAQRSEQSRKTIRALIESLPESALRILDINFRAPWYNREIVDWSIHHCDLIKLNRDEFDGIGHMYGREDVASWLLEDVGVTWICLTKGADGSELIGKECHFIQPVHEADTSAGDSVGVGDAFTARLCHHLLTGTAPEDAHIEASRYASEIVSRQGAMPDVSSILK